MSFEGQQLLSVANSPLFFGLSSVKWLGLVLEVDFDFVSSIV